MLGRAPDTTKKVAEAGPVRANGLPLATLPAVMAFELGSDPRQRVLGAVLLLAGAALIIQFYRTLPEQSVVYVLPYLLPSALLAVGGILAFGGLGRRLRG
jgi:hypothetical protein